MSNKRDHIFKEILHTIVLDKYSSGKIRQLVSTVNKNWFYMAYSILYKFVTIDYLNERNNLANSLLNCSTAYNFEVRKYYLIDLIPQETPTLACENHTS
jgi:hypothetical protein